MQLTTLVRVQVSIKAWGSSNLMAALNDAFGKSRYSQGQIPDLGRLCQPAVPSGSPGLKLCPGIQPPIDCKDRRLLPQLSCTFCR
jgi:hypothetical protein